MVSGGRPVTDLLSQAHYRCTAPGLGLDLGLILPRGLQGLLARMLAGWEFAEVATIAAPDLKVVEDGGFHLISPHYQSGKSWRDIVSILNEVLVVLAYAARAGVPGSQLIHAAGFERDGETTVLFGARKAGKSVFTARIAATGQRIWADDLLLWLPRGREFRGLGIAPRLRRPVLPDILDALPQDALIVGEYTCYLRADRIDLAPAGRVLRPDRLAELQPDQTERPIRLLKVKQEIEAHRIP